MTKDEIQAALDDFETGVRKVLWSRGSYEKFYIDDFFDDDTIKTIRAALRLELDYISMLNSYVLVPVEPTFEIIDAMREHRFFFWECDGYNSAYYSSLYKAMLSAAPEPPQERKD